MPNPLRLLLGAVVMVASLASGCARESAAPARPAATPGRLLHRDDFTDPAGWRDRWTVEQQPGGEVTVADGRMILRSTGGTTVWFEAKLEAPVIITYEATVTSQARVSDLNCFWMATDPKHPGGRDPSSRGLGRGGRFAEYDTLRLYYVGYGGNTNSTTRFRRYAGDGTKPLLPGFDLGEPSCLLEPDRTYTITLIAAAGRAQYVRDGEIVFDFADPEPLTEGWFGFRTVDSRIEIRNFRVHEAVVLGD